MLVLSRKLNQVVQIGDDIFIQVSEIRKSRIRLVISAPADLRISRRDICDPEIPLLVASNAARSPVPGQVDLLDSHSEPLVHGRVLPWDSST